MSFILSKFDKICAVNPNQEHNNNMVHLHVYISQQLTLLDEAQKPHITPSEWSNENY